MQLRTARVCLDCEEVHEAQQCPVCASESFAFLSRWIPAPERRSRPRPPVNEDAVDPERLEAVRRLTTGRVLTRSVVGMTALGIAGWLWGRAGRLADRAQSAAPPADDSQSDRERDRETSSA
jgi:hypothetical protein